ncbi:MAG: GreA/GreB family elongation factor [Verrucomicrobiota bacterium]
MSKAFTRESDDAPELEALPRQPSPLPPGAKNYLTQEGAARLREELNRLIEVDRIRVAASPRNVDAKRQLQMVDQRISQLQQSLRSAVVVSPPIAPEDRLRFGATVTVRERGGAESRYRIVGVEETELDRGWISWVSPLAKALLNARLGQHVRFKVPSGEEELEITGIAYE